MSKIGIFGGSFNPIHNGHINLAETVGKKLNLEKVILVPSCIAPHKPSNEYVSGNHRLKMCELAAEKYDSIEVSDYELNNVRKSYTLYTVEHFKNIYPEDKLYLLMGSDMFLSFDSWYEYKKILSIVSLAVVTRKGNDYNKLRDKSEKISKYGKVYIVETEPVIMSSTEIRGKIKNNDDMSCYLNRKVVKYILLNKLYR